MSEKNIKKIGIRDALGEYIYTDIGVDADKVDIDSSTNLAEKLVEIDNKFEDLEAGGYANKNIYGDEKINLGRKVGTSVGPYSVTIGRDVSATGTCSLAEGNGTAANGNYSHAEGSGTIAKGIYSHAEGVNTAANGPVSHAEGSSTAANGDYSHAEGASTFAIGNCSHAEGYGNTAKGNYSHAEGYDTIAEGHRSHAEGYHTAARGYVSHAEGNDTIARGRAQHVQGKFNVEDIEEKYAHIVGGGTYEERKNIHTLDWNGNAEFAGDVKCSNVLKTVSECTASTKDTDIAGASALAELANNIQIVSFNTGTVLPNGAISIDLGNSPTFSSILDNLKSQIDLSKINDFSRIEFRLGTSGPSIKYENECLRVSSGGMTILSEPFTIVSGTDNTTPIAFVRMPLYAYSRWKSGSIKKSKSDDSFSGLYISAVRLIV